MANLYLTGCSIVFLVTLLQLLIPAVAFQCNMTAICNSAECNCDNLRVDCNNLVTNNVSFFACLDTNVTSLSIYGSDITQINGTEMDRLVDLTTFRLFDTPVTTIDPLAFTELASLVTLEVQNTSLKDLASNIFANLKIQRLSITGSNITKLSSDHFKPIQPTLTELHLSRNNLNEIVNGIFQDDTVNTLQEVDLSFNDFSEVRDTLLQYLIVTTKVNLSHNGISSFGIQAFSLLTSLNEIDLSSNHILQMRENLFPNSPNLTLLDVSWNVLEEVPAAAIGVNHDNFHKLHMDGNKLTELKNGSFIGLPNLREIYLSNMDFLTAVRDDAFMALPLLKMLYMEHNPLLETLEPQAFVEMLNLENLYINDNGLTELHRDMFLNSSFLPSLMQVEVQNNPINCSCAVKWIRQEMDNVDNPWIQPWKQGEKALVCHTPENFNGTGVYEYQVYDLTCDPPMVKKKDQFSEVNGAQYYMEVILDRGIPSTEWITNIGDTLKPEDEYDPGNGHNIMSVREILEPNNTVITRLTILHPTETSEGQFQMKATNVAGVTVVNFNAEPPKDKSTNTLRLVGLIVGVILGTIILLVAFICAIRVIRQRPVPYNRMNEEGSIQRQATGPLPSAAGIGASSHQDEQGPFVSEDTNRSQYGGVDETDREEPKV